MVKKILKTLSFSLEIIKLGFQNENKMTTQVARCDISDAQMQIYLCARNCTIRARFRSRSQYRIAFATFATFTTLLC